MPSDRGIGQDQTKDAASIYATWRDRNTFLTGGGDLSWNPTTGELTWSADIEIYIGSVGKVILAAGNATGISLADDVVAVDVDRSVPSLVGPSVRKITAADNFTADAVILAVRGADSRLYFRDGTVFSDGENKALGSAEAATDRVDFQSDGRLHPAMYVLGEHIASASGTGSTDITGLKFIVTSGAPGFLSSIPNTGGVPDTLTLVEIKTGTATDEILAVANVDSDTELTLVSPGGTASLSGKNWSVYHNAFGYDVSSAQLAVVSNGALQIEGTHYTEQFGPGTSYAIQFASGSEPGVGVWVSFLNIAGGMGPAGPDANTTLQEAYDNSPAVKKIEFLSGQPLDFDAPVAGDKVVEVRVAGGGLEAGLSAGGVWTANEYLIPDGSGDHYKIYANAGELRFEHTASNKGWKITNQGELKPFTASAVGDAQPWVAAYSGSFDVTPSLVTIATGITSGVYGAVLMLEDATSSNHYVAEFNEGSIAADGAVVAYDPATGDVTIGDTVTGAAGPGSDFASQDWTLLLFYAG
jgi:hypothetical protein